MIKSSKIILKIFLLINNQFVKYIYYCMFGNFWDENMNNYLLIITKLFPLFHHN